MTNLQQTLTRIVGKQILVLGDIILDQYCIGNAFRISPEAPVPVIKVETERFVPGGAANVALNCRTLGADVTLIGQSTPDDWKLNSVLSHHKIKIRPGASAEKLTTKSRIVAKGQHVCRFDIDIDCEPHISYEDFMFEARQCDAIILSDYNRGMVCDRILRMASDASKELSIPFILDPKGKPHGSIGMTVLKPNVEEAEVLLGVAKGTVEPTGLCLGILKTFKVSACVLTAGSQGMFVGYLDKGTEQVVQIDALETEPVDVSGCGDTVAATLALALSAGEHVVTAAQLATLAAAVSVSKHYTATVSPAEIVARWNLRQLTAKDAPMTKFVL